MALKELKITFLKDHSPRKKGEVFVAKTNDERRVAEWYLANQIAQRCICEDGESGCPDCAKKAKTEDVVSDESTEVVKTKLTKTKKTE